MSFGFHSGWYTGMDTDLDGKYATAVGHTIESTICYIKPWHRSDGFTNTTTDWINRFSNNPSQMRPFYFDLIVPWASRTTVPKRDLQITIDIAPDEFSYSAVAGEQAAWLAAINSGVWDSTFIAFANMVVAAGLATSHIRIWHEPASWNYWDVGVNLSGWVAAFNRQVSIYRAHGLTGRMGPHWNSTPASYVNLTASAWPGSDCAYYDSYNNDLSPTTKNAYASACRNAGLLVNFSEVGLLGPNQGGAGPSGASDAEGLTYFTAVHDFIQANTDIFDGIMIYNANTSADLTNGSYPNTLAYIRNNMATWEISAGPIRGTTGTNTASVSGSGSTAHFSGTVASNTLNVTIYRDTYGGTKIADVTPSGGNWSYDKTSETNAPHTYVVAMFDSAAGTPGNVTFGPQVYNLTIDSTAPASIVNRVTPVTVVGDGGGSISLNWNATAPHVDDTAVLAVYIGSGGTITTPPAGFVFDHRVDNSTQIGIAIYKRRCTGNSPPGSESGAITVGANFGLMFMSLHVKNGADPVTPFDVSADGTTGGASDVAIPQVTTTKDGVLVMGFAAVVKYGSTTTTTWTPPGGTTEAGPTGGLFGVYSTWKYGSDVVEHIQASAGASAASALAWSDTPSFRAATTIGLRPSAAIAPVESMANFSVAKDLGNVSISVGTITSGIATVKVYEGLTLQGTGPRLGQAATVGLSAPQSVGAHTDQVYGFDVNDIQVAGPYPVTFTVLAAPLIVNTNASLNNVRISANTVTTTIRVYRTIADGGAFVTSHAVDGSFGWDYTSSSTGYVAGRNYDATAGDGTHESVRRAFTTVVVPGTPSIISVQVASSGLASVVWAGLSIRLFDHLDAVIETVTAGVSAPAGGTTPAGDPEYLYARSPGDGHYTITAYNNADPTLATLSDSAPIDIVTQPVGEITLVSASGTLLVSDVSGKLIRMTIVGP